MSNSKGHSDKSGWIKSLEKGFSLLEELKHKDGAGVSELASESEMAKSTVHNYLSTFRKLGYVDQRGGEYVVTIKFLSLGGYARSIHPVANEVYWNAKPEVDELARETEEIVHLMVVIDGNAVVIYYAIGRDGFKTDVHIGKEIPFHATSMGKAYLAQQSEDEIARIIREQGLEELTPETITSREELYEELKSVRETGVAFDNAERFAGMCCVGVPIKLNDDVVGAMSISGPSRRIREEEFTEGYPKLLKESARIIEIKSKYD